MPRISPPTLNTERERGPSKVYLYTHLAFFLKKFEGSRKQKKNVTFQNVLYNVGSEMPARTNDNNNNDRGASIYIVSSESPRDEVEKPTTTRTTTREQKPPSPYYICESKEKGKKKINNQCRVYSSTFQVLYSDRRVAVFFLCKRINIYIY